MDFNEVKEFFKSWGMYPSNEDSSVDSLNPEVIDLGINRKCYEKLLYEAETEHGMRLKEFCSRQIDATDDAFYLSAETWLEVEEAWEALNGLPPRR
jgi:hypothetical protein